MADIFGKIERGRICSLSDKKIFLLGKKGTNGSFLQRCRLRTEQILQEEEGAGQKEICSLGMQQKEAAVAKERAEADLHQWMQAEGSLQKHKQQIRLKKKRTEAEAILRQTEASMEQIRMEMIRRKAAWETLYQEIDAIYRQGMGKETAGNVEKEKRIENEV